MGRSPCCDKNGVKKGPWTPEEDQKLLDYIHLHGPGNWRTLPNNAGLRRCGKSCRLRWTNYLRPDIKRGRFSFEEEETIIQLHRVLGNKWSAIAARLPGRTDNEIKNYWNTHIRKRLIRNGIDPVTHGPRLDLLHLSSILNVAALNPPNLLAPQATLSYPEILQLASLLLPPPQHPIPTHSLHQNLLDDANVGGLQSQSLNDDPLIPSPSSCDQVPINDGLGDQRAMGATDADLPLLIESFDMDSLSPTTVNSSFTEDDRESNCPNFFKFEIPESFSFDEFI